MGILLAKTSKNPDLFVSVFDIDIVFVFVVDVVVVFVYVVGIRCNANNANA